MAIEHRYSCQVAPEDDTVRLDKFLALRIPTYSRVQLRNAIVIGEVTVDGRTAKPSYKLKSGQFVVCELTSPSVTVPQAENIPLDILYEDEELIAINKPSQMVVHPAKGHWNGTLVSALCHHFKQLSTVGGAERPGIIHRLDRDTTGVIVVAKNDQSHKAIAKQFEHRTTRKEYHCLTLGIPDRDRDLIDEPIGPHPYVRERMVVRRDHPKARNAQSFYQILERFRPVALLQVRPTTGRTHQIRVHLHHLGYPVLADKLYGGRSPITHQFLTTGRDSNEKDSEPILMRQALHAAKLTITHPMSGSPITFEAPYPKDLADTISILRA